MDTVLIGRHELAKRLKISTDTLDRLVKAGEGPRVTRITSGRVLFRETDVADWLAHRTEQDGARGKPALAA